MMHFLGKLSVVIVPGINDNFEKYVMKIYTSKM